MIKQIEKQINRLNSRLKADHSSYRFTAVKDSYVSCYRINQCEVQYTDSGKERLVNISLMFQHIEPDEVIRIFIAMIKAIDVLI